MNAQVVTQFIDRLGTAFQEGDPRFASKAAEAANVSLIQDQYRAIARGDFAGALSYLSDDIDMEIVGPADHPMIGRWRGRDDVGKAIAHNFGMVEDQKPEIQSLTAQGDTVVVVARETGRFRSTGKEYELQFVQVFTIRDGKVVRFREFF